jgi:hypothetical protein
MALLFPFRLLKFRWEVKEENVGVARRISQISAD